jgi:hypothetical protein
MLEIKVLAWDMYTIIAGLNLLLGSQPDPPHTRPIGFITSKTLTYLAFQTFDFARTWWRLFLKHVVPSVLNSKLEVVTLNVLRSVS